MRFLKLVVVILSGHLFFTGCSDEAKNVLPNLIDAATFIVRTPEGWKLFEGVGYDTYIGRIAGFNDTLYFDQGFFSFGGLDKISENNSTIYFQHTTVDGVPAIIHKEQIQYGTGEAIRLSIYLETDGKARLNHLYAINPFNERILLEIFNTHKFK